MPPIKGHIVVPRGVEKHGQLGEIQSCGRGFAGPSTANIRISGKLENVNPRRQATTNARG